MASTPANSAKVGGQIRDVSNVVVKEKAATVLVDAVHGIDSDQERM
ncbi:MAG: hypothetical protein O7E53_05155 [Alphaproteobacteria bacterium]|nr:hypothetical protein [Alphaproteobacteria bacterium]